MNIKDMYLHGGSSIMKNISFAIASSGNNNGKLVATITWAKEDASTTQLAIPLNGASFGSQTKNYVLAAPSTANGNPTFRALVAADIPDLGAGKITSGEFAAARLPLATNSAKGAVILGVAKTSDADSAITDKKYWVKMNANGKLFVDIPWTDHTYTVNNATFSIKSKIGTNDAVTLSDFTANQSAADDFTLILGSNITFTNDATNRTLTIAGTPNTTYKLTLNGTVKGTTGGTDLGTFYAIATSDTSTANQVWMRNSSNNGYGWRTLGNHAFDSTAYLPLTGGTISNNDFAPFFIQCNHTANAAAMGFKHYSSGTTVEVMGYIGMSEKDGALKRWDGAISTAYTILDSSNSSVSKSGETLTVKINGASQSLTNTWRGIQDNLTSSSATTQSLSAKQGYLLANGSARDNTKLPIAGGTMTGTLVMKTNGTTSSSYNQGIRINRTATDKWAVLLIGKSGDAVTGTGTSTAGDGAWLIGTPASSNSLIFCLNEYSNENSGMCLKGNGTNDFKWKGNTVYHAGNIPSNAKDTAGIVTGPGAAGKVYISNSSGAPTWDTFDTTVTSGSSHLVTSGAVHTAIVNNVAGAVQYLGTVASEAAMKGLSNAGFGDFARVTTAFTFTDASGASVTAHVGDIVYLTSSAASAYATSANWIVAHTEIDTNTWTAASTSAAGYIPKLVTGGANLASTSNDYILSFVNGTDTTPVWKKLPANAYKNDNTWRNIYTGGTSRVGSGTDTKAINFVAGSNISISYEAAGTGSGQSGSADYFNVKIANTYSLPLAANGTRGGIQIGYTSTSKNLAVKLSSEKAYVELPLTLTPNATGFSISGGTTSKTLTVGADYTLGAACAKSVTDNSSNKDVTSSDTNLITGRTLYYQLANKGYVQASNIENYKTTTIASASYSLSKDSWTTAITLPSTAGTYALYIEDSTNGVYAGIFSVSGTAGKLEEIPLHWYSKAATTADANRIYAGTSGSNLVLAAVTAASYTLTIKYKRII